MSTETLWRQCIQWMCALEVLPPKHRLLSEEATAETLAYTLRDGVLLCQIANSLAPGCVDQKQVNHRPHLAQFLCLKNIRLFLSALSVTFGIEKECDLFDPSMLYNFSDFARVLNTLSKLSLSPKAKLSKPLVPSFPKICTSCFSNDVYESSLDDYNDEDDEEHIYKRLEDMHSEDKYKEFYIRQRLGSNRQRSQYSFSDDHAEKVYIDVCGNRSRGLGSDKNHQDLRTQILEKFELREKRDHCIKELIETESNYNDALNILRQNFIKTMNTLKEGEKKTIFMNIIELGDVHAAFFRCLLESISGKTSARRIGDIFVEFKERFLKYGEYCSNLQHSLETLDTLCSKNPSVASEVEFCEKNTDNGRFRLRDLLAVPMQRILKYHLILKELLVRTPNNHDEHRSTQHAFESMIDVAEFINEVKRDSESIAIIKEIQLSIIDWNMPSNTELKDYGRMHKDGELLIHNHNTVSAGTGKNPRQRYLFVFDKVLLICKAIKGDQYRFVDSLRLCDYKIEDIKTPPKLSSTSFLSGSSKGTIGRRVMRRDYSRWTHAFLLAHVSNTNAYTLFSRTEQDKEKWISAFKEAMETINPPQGQNSPHQVQIFTFTQPATCEACRKLLKGSFFQGYKCIVCCRVLHKECIPQLTICGKSSMPPARPPRPPSMLLPTASNLFSLDDPTQCQRSTSTSLRGSSPRFSEPPSSSSSSFFNQVRLSECFLYGANNDYVNLRMEDHSWYVGPMERIEANTKLAPYPSNTFLVRSKMVNGEITSHVVSMKTDSDIKHMRIETEVSKSASFDEDENGVRIKESSQYLVYYLSETRNFRSIVDLITYYSRNSLKECFSGLDALLLFPIGEVTIVRALHDHLPGKEDKNRLSFRKGDQIAVVDKQGDSGWWKAFDGNNIGYIPKDFVTEVPL